MARSDQIRWVVQQDFADPQTIQNLKNACYSAGCTYTEAGFSPFDPGMHKTGEGPIDIYYGSSALNYMSLVDNEKFSEETCSNKRGVYMLDYSFSVTTLGELVNVGYEITKTLFIRPVDSSLFKGEKIKFGEIDQWYASLCKSHDGISSFTQVIASVYYTDPREWRVWIVQGEVVASSLYSENYTMKKERGCPSSLEDFVRQRCNEYTPGDVFVMDICLSDGHYYIANCSSIHHADFFAADIDAIVRSVSGYFVRHNGHWLLEKTA